MNRCPDDDELRHYLDDKLAESVADSISQHLESCSACQAKLEQFTARPSLVIDPNLTTAFVAASHRPDEIAGRVLGSKYRLTEKIGAGGMGSVWAAQQTEPVKRKVAVKLIRAGMESEQVLARFEAERQALAMMDHPNIARVLDGGLDDGRPYFVMELVKGVPITEFCDERRLTITERLALFVPVCQAIQHAHQKGIIHRDIKPSNVLVALFDDRPVPKVIDFGVAKATIGTLTEATLDTGFGAVVGTPQYMSPEQATFNNLDIDTRSDVYSLGVLLYELLAGSPPFTKLELEQKGFLEILRVVREDDPPRPSTKLSTADGLPSLSANRSVEPKRLTGLLRNELDWIVMKALEKDRGRRYDTANAFAADVSRYLVGEPVLAHPPSRAYLARKFVHRHRGSVIAASLVAAALIVAIVGTTLGLLSARRAAEAERLAKNDADDKRKVAEEQTALATDTRDFLKQDVLRMANPDVQQEMQTLGLRFDANLTIREVVVHAAGRIDGRFPKSPLSEAEIRTTLGSSLSGSGLYDLALPHHERARAIYLDLYGPDHTRSIALGIGLAQNYSQLGRFPEAMALRQELFDRCHRVLGADHSLSISAKEALAGSFERSGRRDEALRLRDEVIETRRRLDGPDAPSTGRAMEYKARTLTEMGRTDEAHRIFADLVEARRKKLGDDHLETLSSKARLADSLEAIGRHEPALYMRDEIWKGRKIKLGEDHPLTLGAAHNLAISYEDAGRLDEALQLRESVFAIQKSKLGRDHPDTLNSMSALANSYVKAKRPMNALKFREEVVELQTRRLGPENISTLMSRTNLGNSYESLGRHNDAYTLRRETLAICRKALGLEHRETMNAMWNIIGSLVALKRHDEALEKIRELLDLAAVSTKNGKPPNPQLRPNMLTYRFNIFHERGDVAGCRAATADYEAMPPLYPWYPYNAARFRCRIVALLKDRPDEVEVELGRAIEQLKKAVATNQYDRGIWDVQTDLDPLRNRDDYRKLAAALPAKRSQ